jgi:hypothetical protein
MPYLRAGAAKAVYAKDEARSFQNRPIFRPLATVLVLSIVRRWYVSKPGLNDSEFR